MESFVGLILAGFSVTLLDIDNAMYASGQISTLDSRRRLVLFLSLSLEFAARLGLFLLFVILANETEPLFHLFGYPVTLEALSLFAAGTYLLISNGRELADSLQEKNDTGEAEVRTTSRQSLPRLLIAMTLLLTLMSVDTMLVISGMTAELGMVLYLLLFSMIVRLLFVERIVHFVELYPAVQLFILAILVFIGVELILQGFGLEGEIFFNLFVIIAALVIIAYQWRKTRQRSG